MNWRFFEPWLRVAVLAVILVYAVVIAAVVFVAVWQSWSGPSESIKQDYADTVRPALLATGTALSEHGFAVPELTDPPLPDDLRSGTPFSPDDVDVVFRFRTGDVGDTGPPIPFDDIDRAIDAAREALTADGHYCPGHREGSFACYSEHWLIEVFHAPQMTGFFIVISAQTLS